MSAATSTASDKVQTVANQIKGEITTGLSGADASSAEGIASLGLVHQARVSHLTRTAASAVTQYGQNSTEAATAQAAVTATQATIAKVNLVKLQTSTATPQVSASGWALHGRIINAQLQPVASYTVFLVDAQHAYQSDYGFAYTDATGYFQLSFAGAAPSTDKQSKKSASATPPPSQLFVEVANAKGQPIYLASTAFQPIVGTATYQTHQLPANESPLGDPPEAIKKTAMPPSGKVS
jgi:hypothetical protein